MFHVHIQSFLYISDFYVWPWYSVREPRIRNYYFILIYFVAAPFGAKPNEPRVKFGPKPNEPDIPRLKPPWQAISGVFPKPRKMRSTILSRMVPFSGREASRRADSRRNRLVTKRTNWPTTVYVTYHRPCSKPNYIFRGGTFWIVPANEIISW